MSGPGEEAAWPPAADANPFAAPATAPGRGTGGADGTGPGMVRHVTPVAILLIVQGGLELLLAVMFVGLAAVVPAMFSGIAADAGPMESMMIAVYGVMAAGGFLAGGLHVAAGICGLRFRGRVLGIVALALGMASVTTVYCAPTAIGLAIYGLMTYCNPAVVAAFALGAQGVPAAEIRARYGG